MAARPWCFYYVQGEEGEAPEEPNAFQVRDHARLGVDRLKHAPATYPT